MLNDMHAATEFAVLDVETSGFDPGHARVLSVAVLVVTADGAIRDAMHTLLDPGVDPGPTNIHGLTAAMLAGQPHFPEIADQLATLLHRRVLVAHNAGFADGQLLEAPGMEAPNLSSHSHSFHAGISRKSSVSHFRPCGALPGSDNGKVAGALRF